MLYQHVKIWSEACFLKSAAISERGGAHVRQQFAYCKDARGTTLDMLRNSIAVIGNHQAQRQVTAEFVENG